MPRRRSVSSSISRFSSVEEAFGAALAGARAERGYSQVDLSAISTVSQAFVSQLETGQRQVGLKQMIQLALALDLTPDELMRRTVERLEPRALKHLLDQQQ